MIKTFYFCCILSYLSKFMLKYNKENKITILYIWGGGGQSNVSFF